MSSAHTTLLAELSSLLDLPALQTDDNGVSTLVVDGFPLNISADARDEQIVLFTPIGQIDIAREPERMTRMLRINGAGAGAITVGLAASQDLVLLSARRPRSGLDAEELARWAGAFSDTARHWRDWLAASPDEMIASPVAPAHWVQG